VASGVLKPAQMRELSVKELKEKLVAFEEEMFNLRFQANMGQLSNPLRLRALRREVSRARTVLHAKSTSETAAKMKA
jgi:large subunit ribosomal protein L29